MNETDRIFASYFANKLAVRPRATETKDPRRIYGYLNEYRIEIFAEIHTAERLSDPIWSQCRGIGYMLMHDNLFAVLSFYDNDGVVLWLDDHADDSDFGMFVQREHLVRWLPDRANEVLDLLVKTKFFFLGWPNLIRNVADVPPPPEWHKRWLQDMGQDRWSTILDKQQARESLSNEEKRLLDVADLIQSPMYIQLENGDARLTFFVWTKFLGKIFKIDTYFGKNDSFRYEGTQIAELVGYYTIPR